MFKREWDLDVIISSFAFLKLLKGSQSKNLKTKMNVSYNKYDFDWF